MIKNADYIGELLTKLVIAEMALIAIKNNLGIPQPGYPAPVTVAYEIAEKALKAIENTEVNK